MSKVKLLLYCTKAKPLLWKYSSIDYEGSKYKYDEATILNGKIVAECDCEKVEKWVWNRWWNYYAKNTDSEIQNIDDEDIKKSCLTFGDLYDYLFENDGYALHLSNVNIFDKPKELNKYYKDDFFQELNNNDTRVNKAPQNMCRAYDRFGNKYILISIRPEWLCKILNGEKTIEVRRVVTNNLKKLIGE